MKPKTIEEIKEEFGNILDRFSNDDFYDFDDMFEDFLAIEIGGEVSRKCNDYEQESKHYGHHYCTTCHGTNKISRPKTVRDCLEGR